MHAPSLLTLLPVATAVLGAAQAAPETAAPPTDARPNILVIITDDHSFQTLGR